MEIELPKATRTWLLEVERRSERGEVIDPMSLRVELADRLPPGFISSQIDYQLWDGQSLTAFSILALHPESKKLKDLESAILTIARMLRLNPSLRTITDELLASELKLDTAYTQQLLKLMSTVGNYWSSASGVQGRSGYQSITLGREENIVELLSFKSLRESLRARYRPKAPQQQGLDNPPLRVPRFLPANEAMSELLTKPNTAFILMQIDPSKPELEDISNGIKEICRLFGITALRADDIEHQERITDVVLDNIRQSEFLIADLTAQRPNIYYEIGFAHALNKRPILFRHVGTPLHFDLLVHNVPEYENITDLKKRLKDRLEAMLGRKARE